MAEGLVEFVRQCGGFCHSDVDFFKVLSNNDRGVVAVKDIPSGSNLLVVPVNCTLHLPRKGSQAPAPSEGHPPAAAAEYLMGAGAAAGEGGGSASPFINTVLLLLAEMARGDASPWAPYIASLPRACDTCLLSWTEEDKKELKGTSIEDRTGGGSVEAEFRRDVEPRLMARPDLWPAPYNTLQEFIRVAGLVQSRAFHMVAENVLVGTRREGDELFLIPIVDMINHATDASKRNASLCKFNSSMRWEDLSGKEHEFTGFFVMKAERDIKAGEQVLHTYGELSDAQLVATYGFLDQQPDIPPPAQEQGASDTPSPQKGKGGKASPAAGGKRKRGAEGGAPVIPSFTNPHNFALVPLSLVRECTLELLGDAMPEEAQQGTDAKQKLSELQATKIAFLEEAGLLQQGAAERTEFVLTRGKPLTDELLTAVQVLLMMGEEFEQLVEEWRSGAFDESGSGSDDDDEEEEGEEDSDEEEEGEEEEEEEEENKGKAASKGKAKGSAKAEGVPMAGAAAAAGGSDAVGSSGLRISASTPAAQEAIEKQLAAAAGGKEGGDTGQQEEEEEAGGKRKPLLLGTALLMQDIEFAELVSLSVIQILDKCLSEYPTTLAQDAALLASLSSRGTASSSTAGSGGSTGAAAGGSARKARKTEKGKAAGQVEDKEREATGSGAGGSAGGGDEASLSQQRKRLAMMVRMGEKEVLQMAKKQVVGLVLKLQTLLDLEEKQAAAAAAAAAQKGSSKKQQAKGKPGAGSSGAGGSGKGAVSRSDEGDKKKGTGAGNKGADVSQGSSGKGQQAGKRAAPAKAPGTGKGGATAGSKGGAKQKQVAQQRGKKGKAGVGKKESEEGEEVFESEDSEDKVGLADV